MRARGVEPAQHAMGRPRARVELDAAVAEHVDEHRDEREREPHRRGNREQHSQRHRPDDLHERIEGMKRERRERRRIAREVMHAVRVAVERAVMRETVRPVEPRVVHHEHEEEPRRTAFDLHGREPTRGEVLHARAYDGPWLVTRSLGSCAPRLAPHRRRSRLDPSSRQTCPGPRALMRRRSRPRRARLLQPPSLRPLPQSPPAPSL